MVLDRVYYDHNELLWSNAGLIVTEQLGTDMLTNVLGNFDVAYATGYGKSAFRITSRSGWILYSHYSPRTSSRKARIDNPYRYMRIRERISTCGVEKRIREGFIQQHF